MCRGLSCLGRPEGQQEGSCWPLCWHPVVAWLHGTQCSSTSSQLVSVPPWNAPQPSLLHPCCACAPPRHECTVAAVYMLRQHQNIVSKAAAGIEGGVMAVHGCAVLIVEH